MGQHSGPPAIVKLMVAERRKKMIDARIEGKSFAVIAAELGYGSPSAASKDFSRALEKAIARQHLSAEVVIETEILRLDRMLVALNPGVTSGNTKSIDTALRVAERRAKLLGLDKATKVQVINIDAIDAEIQRLEAEMAARSKNKNAATLGSGVVPN